MLDALHSTCGLDYYRKRINQMEIELSRLDSI